MQFYDNLISKKKYEIYFGTFLIHGNFKNIN